ncbi:hypothetical protein WMY93_022152 [Mugilogobius chulae]|uniref:C2H2-type domain-containing protein n=1 Tax=Mugilogobius chulae TaxID=88201 RepID=A0AAW0NCR2_9GOBI
MDGLTHARISPVPRLGGRSSVKIRFDVVVKEDLADPHIQHPHKLFRYMAEGERDSLEWKCKLCPLSLDTQANLFTHYRLKHGSYSMTGFPPDVLHDLLEGVVPVELALCLD